MMAAAIAPLKARYERLNARERASLASAAIALILGVELLAVTPIRDKRNAVSQALSASARSEIEARTAAATARRARQEDIEHRLQHVQQDLANYGINGPMKDSLSFLLSRTLEGQRALVVSLRTLTSSTVPIIEAPADPAAAAAAAATAASSAPEERQLYQHRYELKLEGALQDLTPAIDALQNNARPLRVESMRIAAHADGVLEATVVLVTMGTEKAWLKL